MSIKIVTDSTCDLPYEFIAKYDITIIPLIIHIGFHSFLDGIELSKDIFYKNLLHYSNFPTTSPPGIDTFRLTYEKLIKEGASHIISIHISNKMSATVDIAKRAAILMEHSPINVIDSRQVSLGTGFLVQSAAEMAICGIPLKEILSNLEDQISRTRVFVALSSLEFLRRSGRVNGLTAGLGSLLKIKPIIKMYNGIPAIESIQSQERAISRILQLLEDLAPFEKLALVHSHAPVEIPKLLLKKKPYFPTDGNIVAEITPVIGAHIGPGAIGFAAISSK